MSSKVALLQDTVVWRARLSTTALPKEQIQFFAKGDMTGVCYPIADDQYIWTVSASAARMREVGLDVRAGPSKAKQSEVNRSDGQRSRNQHGDGEGSASLRADGTELSASEVGAYSMVLCVWSA